MLILVPNISKFSRIFTILDGDIVQIARLFLVIEVELTTFFYEYV